MQVLPSVSGSWSMVRTACAKACGSRRSYARHRPSAGRVISAGNVAMVPGLPPVPARRPQVSGVVSPLMRDRLVVVAKAVRRALREPEQVDP